MKRLIALIATTLLMSANAAADNVAEARDDDRWAWVVVIDKVYYCEKTDRRSTNGGSLPPTCYLAEMRSRW